MNPDASLNTCLHINLSLALVLIRSQITGTSILQCPLWLAAALLRVPGIKRSWNALQHGTWCIQSMWATRERQPFSLQIHPQQCFVGERKPFVCIIMNMLRKWLTETTYLYSFHHHLEQSVNNKCWVLHIRAKQQQHSFLLGGVFLEIARLNQFPFLMKCSDHYAELQRILPNIWEVYKHDSPLWR